MTRKNLNPKCSDDDWNDELDDSLLEEEELDDDILDEQEENNY